MATWVTAMMSPTPRMQIQTAWIKLSWYLGEPELQAEVGNPEEDEDLTRTRTTWGSRWVGRSGTGQLVPGFWMLLSRILGNCAERLAARCLSWNTRESMSAQCFDKGQLTATTTCRNAWHVRVSDSVVRFDNQGYYIIVRQGDRTKCAFEECKTRCQTRCEKCDRARACTVSKSTIPTSITSFEIDNLLWLFKNFNKYQTNQ